jgi:hypothetical protein
VRVVQSRRELDLSKKSFRAETGGEIGVQHLECYDAIVFCILSEINCRHAAASKLAVYGVAA